MSNQVNWGKAFGNCFKSGCKQLGMSRDALFNKMSSIASEKKDSSFPTPETLKTYVMRGFPSRYYSEYYSAFMDIFLAAIDDIENPIIKQLWNSHKDKILASFLKIHNDATL